MPDLLYRQQKIQEKRKQTPWREFVREIASRQPISLYKNNGKISRFPITGREGTLVEQKIFDATRNLRGTGEIDSSDFFQSLQTVFRSCEKMYLMQWFENENCDYAEVFGCKNAYLSFSVGNGVENIFYSIICGTNIKNVFNAFSVFGNCENIYSSRMITNSFNIFFSSNIHNSNNIRYSTNLIGCTECLGCDNLENQSYCIANVPYEKEAYLALKEQKKREFTNSSMNKQLTNFQSTNVAGNGITFSSDIENGYFVTKIHTARNIFVGEGGGSGENLFYDCFDAGIVGSNNFYGIHYSGEESDHLYCCSSIAFSSHIYYSYFLESCSFCLGCVGLKNKSFCILNKQYTKEERHQKVDEIFSQMEQDRTLGQFFPGSMNPFYFNDTAAYLIDPTFTKEEVTTAGYLRRDEPLTVDIPQGAELVSVDTLSQYEGVDENNNRTIAKDIMKKIIQDKGGNIYRIMPMEYEFLMKHGLPLPRQHRLDRMRMNFSIH